MHRATTSRPWAWVLLLGLVAACAESADSTAQQAPTTLPSMTPTPTLTPAPTPTGFITTPTPTVPAISALGLANSPNYIAQVSAALQVLNLPPVNSLVPVSPARARKFIFHNRTSIQLWIGAAGNTHGNALIGGGGWLMDANTHVAFTIPMPFTSARFWARPVCAADPNNSTCGTPVCSGPNQTSCTLGGTTGLTTLFEINMGSQGSDLDFYDISNVDAYNLPIAVIPVPGSYSGANSHDPFSCGSIAFAQDLDATCPAPLQVTNPVTGAVVDCKNQCGVDGLKEIPLCTTCTGAGECETNVYSLAFKNACPGCYSFSYDDATSTYACLGADYEVIFGVTGRATFIGTP